MPTPSALFKILLASVDSCVNKWNSQYSKWIGQLLIPPLIGSQSVLTDFICADNFAFSNWNEQSFCDMCEKVSRLRMPIRWVAVPDVVGDWKETLTKFEGWNAFLRSLKLKRAFVLQDGQPENLIPWIDISAVFLGGSTEYKLSDEALEICIRARSRGMWVHVGRVNSIKRISRFVGVAHSIDGMSFSRYPDENLPKVLEWLSQQ